MQHLRGTTKKEKEEEKEEKEDDDDDDDDARRLKQGDGKGGRLAGVNIKFQTYDARSPIARPRWA